MGVNFSWDDDGLKRFLEDVGKSATRQVAVDQQRVIRGMTCPTHGTQLNVAVSPAGSMSAQITAGGFCCQQFADQVTDYMRSASRRRAA